MTRFAMESSHTRNLYEIDEDVQEHFKDKIGDELPNATKVKTHMPAKNPTPKAQRQLPNAEAQRQRLIAKDKNVTPKSLAEKHASEQAF